MTRSQVQQKYGSKEIADQICDAKLRDAEVAKSHTKWHPDAINNEAMWAVVMHVPYCNVLVPCV